VEIIMGHKNNNNQPTMAKACTVPPGKNNECLLEK